MRHRGGRVGNSFVAEKEAVSEFTSEDVDVLAVFAARRNGRARTWRP